MHSTDLFAVGLVEWQVKCANLKAQQSTSNFVDEIYDQMRQTLNDYEIFVRRWPEYAVVLENVSPTFWFLSWPVICPTDAVIHLCEWRQLLEVEIDIEMGHFFIILNLSKPCKP